MTMHPYASPAYAQAFGQGYTPVYLPQAQACVLKRPITSCGHFDAMGCYPLMPVAPAVSFAEDFALLREFGCVSLVLVADPFFHPATDVLAREFDLARPFKEHFLHDFSLPRDFSKHHRHEVSKANAQCDVRIISLTEYLHEWCVLYDRLVQRQNIGGLQAFARDYFVALAAMNPLMVGAFVGEELVCAHLGFEWQGYAYSHLGASNEVGYRVQAAYAVYAFMLDHYAAQGVRCFDLGGGAGVAEASQGLSFFKRGFSNRSAMSLLCGKILDAGVYDALSTGKRTEFFPAYRA